MEHQRVQRASNWSPTFQKHSSPSNESPPKTVQKKTTPASSSEQSVVDKSPEPSDWLRQDPTIQQIIASDPVLGKILQQDWQPSISTEGKANTDAVGPDAVGPESIQLKRANNPTGEDSVQAQTSQLQQDSSNSSVPEVPKAANEEKSSASKIQQVAATGFKGSAASLPHLNRIQQSFGVDLSGVQAYVGGDAAAACQRMGAQAYASGNQIAFKEQPSLELAAHEAAHVVQQASGKVQLRGGVGKVGDEYENHADAVAAKVAAGESAVPLLTNFSQTNSGGKQPQGRSPTYKDSTSSELSQTITNPLDEATRLIDLSAVSISKGKYQDALDYLEQALALDPNNSRGLYNKALALLYLGDFRNAIELNEQALRIDTNWGSAYPYHALNNIGVSLYNLDKFNEAIQAFREALDKAPHDELVLKNLRFVQTLLPNNPSLGNQNQQTAPSSRAQTPTRSEINITDSRTQLADFSPAIKALLGGEETFKPENQQQLLKVGSRLQQLPREEFEYIYQPFFSSQAGDLNRLESSIDIFTNTRTQVISGLRSPGSTSLDQTINNTLFGEKPITSNGSWQQILKDLIASVLQSPLHASEVLVEIFDYFKEHWVQFVGLTVALIAAQASVAVLTGLPEPTFLSKVLAVALQGFILAVYGVGIVVSVQGAINESKNWLDAASTANGNPEAIAEASRAFLRMVGNLLLLILSSKQFQEALTYEKRVRLLAMLNRRQQRTRLPNTHKGLTIDLEPDPNNPNRYIYTVRSNPSDPRLPPSSAPSINPPNRQPTAPPPSSGGDLQRPIRPPRASAPPTPRTTPGSLTSPTSTGQTAKREQIPPSQVRQPQVPNTPPSLVTGEPLTPQTAPNGTNPTIFAEPPEPRDFRTRPSLRVTQGQPPVPSSQSRPIDPVQTPAQQTPESGLPVTEIPLTPEHSRENDRSVRQISVINALGEVHEFKIFPDGTIIRCSDPCAELGESIRLLLKELLIHPTDDTIRTEANEILQLANQLIQDSKAKTKDELQILNDLSTLETWISQLKILASQGQNPESSILVNVEAMRQTLGEEVFQQALLERGQDGLQQLQELMGMTSREATKALLDNGLEVKRLIDLIAENGVLYVKLILEVTQLAQTSEVIANYIKTAVELLNMTPSEALQELNNGIKEQQAEKSREQFATARRTLNTSLDWVNRPRHLQDPIELSNLQAKLTNEQVNAANSAAITKAINNAVARIDTIVNPQNWAKLPCFAGETPVWTIDGVKRIDSLQPGEKVWTFDEKLQQIVPQKIIKVLQNRTVHFYDIEVGNSIVQATGNHPFWVEDRSEWIAARDLLVGMNLKQLDGKSSQIESINLREGLHSNTYNLSIDKTRNYFVGAGVLVHNENVVDYSMGGENYKIYTGKNSKYPNKIYVGITKQTLTERLAQHHDDSLTDMRKIERTPASDRTAEQLAALEFYNFKLGITQLELQAQGIKNKDYAEYIEENLVRFYEREGQLQVTNRERGRRAQATMDARARIIANDEDVLNSNYCN